MQNLSDCGLNPFAVKLLVESYKRHPKPAPAAFIFDGVAITLGHDPNLLMAAPDLLAACEAALARLEQALSIRTKLIAFGGGKLAEEVAQLRAALARAKAPPAGAPEGE